ncbi:unnamed protein product [Phyllotreta striolata]|uniref:FK506-binding protein n=1 Tax=Phyllotreta striolata TaxID=444603 RepID=A0A9P0DNZ0_PHYSR|nr:unnamed protein product [Phyllotreta striolata]
MFWGLIMEPKKAYSQTVEKAMHISMAALDVSSSGTDVVQVMVGLNGKNYLLCSLKTPDLLQCPLDLNFDVGDEICLATNGNSRVHLTGYLIEDQLLDDIDDEEEDDEEEMAVARTKSERKTKRINNDKLMNGPPEKIKKSNKKASVVEAESEDDEEDDDDSSNDDDDEVAGNGGFDLRQLLEKSIASEDDDDADFNTSDLEDEEGADEGDEDDEDEDEDEDMEEEESEDDAEEEASSSEDNTEVKTNGTPLTKAKGKKNESKTSLEKQSPNKKESKKILNNGLVIEDIKAGQGNPAKPGRIVTVYYEGRLKNNNKVFDATKQGKGFSFKLGSGEVIKGWDVGLVGMKIGGKRRITCPPNMAYGAKGSPPAIPANATLVFEVELKKMR